MSQIRRACELDLLLGLQEDLDEFGGVVILES